MKEAQLTRVCHVSVKECVTSTSSVDVMISCPMKQYNLAFAGRRGVCVSACVCERICVRVRLPV